MIELSDRERDIVSCLQFQADADIISLHKACGHSVESIRECLKKCIESGAFRIAPMIDIFRMGLIRHCVLFSLRPEARGDRARLIDSIQKYRHVAWSAELGGEFDLVLSLVGRSTAQVFHSLADFQQGLGDIFRDKMVVAQHRITLFPLKYLRGNPPIRSLSWNANCEPVDTDVTDRQLLTVLSATPVLAKRDVCRSLGMSLQELEQRLSKLRMSGIYLGCSLVPNPALFGRQAYTIQIFARGISKELREALYTFSEQHPDVVKFVENFGAWDFEVGVQVEQPQDAAAISDDLVRCGGKAIGHVKIVPEYRELKVALYPLGTENMRVSERASVG